MIHLHQDCIDATLLCDDELTRRLLILENMLTSQTQNCEEHEFMTNARIASYLKPHAVLLKQIYSGHKSVEINILLQQDDFTFIGVN